MGERAEIVPDAALTSAIEAMEQRIATSPPHEVLGVAPTADRRAVRDAYFALCQRFHPDAYAGQNLGPWRTRLSRVFHGLTTAYEALAPRRRSSAALDAVAAVPRAEPPPSPGTRAAAPETTARAVPPSEVRAPAPPLAPRETAPPADRSGAYAVAPRAAPPAPPPVAPVAPIASAPSKRESGVQPRPAAPSTARPVTPPAARAAAAPPPPATPASSMLASLLRTADDALARGDVVGASNAIAVATKLAPGDPALRARSDALAAQIAAAQTRAYAAQARVEEQVGRWDRAAAIWLKAVHSRPDDGALLLRAAHAQLRTGSDVAAAVALARRAARADPRSADAHAVLAWALAVAGVHAEARTTLETALRLDPHASLANNLLRRIGRPR